MHKWISHYVRRGLGLRDSVRGRGCRAFGGTIAVLHHGDEHAVPWGDNALVAIEHVWSGIVLHTNWISPVSWRWDALQRQGPRSKPRQ